MTMTLPQQVIIIGMAALATMLTRFLPFLLFPADKPTPAFVRYLGKVLPPAVLGMLVVYCLKEVNLLTGNHGIPELLSAALVTAVHFWKRQMLLSIAAGTVCYMLLIQLVF